MTATMKTMELTLNRTIPASTIEVFDAWLDPKSPCNPWYEADKLIFNPKVDGLFYFKHIIDGTENPHFGRFTILDRPNKIQQTWMSRHTRGLESAVTVTFQKKGEDTLLTLHHANLPDDEKGRMHEQGWGYYLGLLARLFPPKQG